MRVPNFDLKNGLIDCPILIATSDNYLPLLKPFCYLFNEFWSDKQSVTFLGYKKPKFKLPKNFHFVSLGEQRGVKYWSNDIKKYLLSIDCEHFIYTAEDMFLARKVDFKALASLLNIVKKYKLSPTRIALGNAIANQAHNIFLQTPEYEFIIQNQVSQYRLSLQWSIWKKEYFIKHLHDNFSQWDYEIKNMQSVCNDGKTIIGLKDNFPLGFSNAVVSCGAIKQIDFEKYIFDFKDTCSSNQDNKRTKLDRKYVDRMIELGYIDKRN